MNRQGFEIISAVFEPLERPAGPGWHVRIAVAARNIEHRALPFRARVGEQKVQMLGVTPAGDRFEGYLENLPRAGDRLYVGYGFAHLPTDVVYQPNQPRPLVS